MGYHRTVRHWLITASRLLAVALGLALGLGAPAAASTLVYCYETSPETFTPSQMLGQSTGDATKPIFNKMVEMERGSTKLLPALAESWTVSDDGLVYTFRLRRGVKWHTTSYFKPTRDFNADDVIFSFERQRNPEHPWHKIGGGRYGLFVGTGFDKLLKALDKVDDHTVRFTLSQPAVAFLQLLAVETFAIVSAEYHDAMMKAGTPDRTATHPIGTGPFAFVAYQKDAMIRYKAHPEHWAKAVPGMEDRLARVDNLVYLITVDPTVRYAKLKAGECHLMRFPNPADIKAMRADGDLQVFEIPSADYAMLSYNTEKKPFGDKRVRQALNLAIDKKAIMDAIYLGETGVIAGAVIPPVLMGHDATIKPYPYDPERAKKLLAEAGHPNGFSADLWAMPVVRAYMPNAKRTAELIQADLAKIGVTATIKTVEWGQYLRRTQEGEHEMVLLGWNYAHGDPGQILVLGWSCVGARNGLNRSRWCNKEFDDAILKAEVIRDEAERVRLYRTAQKIFHEEAPALLIAYASKLAIGRKNVVGYKLTPVGSETLFGVGVRE